MTKTIFEEMGGSYVRCREIIISLASHCPKKNRNQ